ncbi:MAG: OB-fold domain-containing protein [Alphaproteobacteria bacterium]|nr:OB-fold domain-containing protein [Alphaproteobacteria bacterium]
MPTEDYFSGPGPERRYYDYLKEGKFMIQRSRSSGNFTHYPRVMEPATGAADLEWVEASGDGVVYATTVNRQRSGDYNIALIDLAEGPRMMSRVVGIEPADVKIGMKVKAKVDKIGDHDAVVFEPAE